MAKYQIKNAIEQTKLKKKKKTKLAKPNSNNGEKLECQREREGE